MFLYLNFSLGCGSNTDCPERHYCRHSLIQDPAENKTESRCVKASNNIRIISESKPYIIILLDWPIYRYFAYTFQNVLVMMVFSLY